MENAAGADMSENRMRVLIVEDEMIVAMFLEDVLAELGYEVAGVVSRLDDALVRAESPDFDCAILDVHVNGQAVFPFADRLVEKHIPFAFATGYGQRGIPDSYRGRPVLQKPFAQEDLDRVIASLR
jgi:CheY-like chemotaxis protein